ncbi:ATP-grasp domain-containing protein [Chitinivibrio alkaliphilus]|uniref:ATP-grasp protein n=1 Tax=Chitinivibrio alkaliphilus ACht1 TaxID=1313304 RepID=U7D5G6_9BACT|nr:ATP-grasp domain-containing protein [Chitinivibrio alkaliphilus]ERP30806.1 ATP-grasp protein [Chitinivibrio alkaliphilus ACht1]
MKTKNAVIIFSGENQRGIIAFCRYASKFDIPFYIITSGEKDSIYLTDYSKKVVGQRKNKGLVYDEIFTILKEVMERCRINEGFVLPSTEDLNSLLFDKRKELQSCNIYLPLVDKEIYDQVGNKRTFTKICASKGLGIPKEFEDVAEISYPFVLKPNKTFGNDKSEKLTPLIITNEDQLKKKLPGIDLEDYFLQEFIEGNSHYLLLYISKKDNHIKYAQENIIQQQDGASMVAAVPSDLYKEELADKYIDLLKGLNFYGLVMVELKYWNNQFYMIEANPRLWGPSQFFVDANVPIFGEFLIELGFKLEDNSRLNEEAKYFWFGGVMENYQYGKQLTFYNTYNAELLVDELPLWLTHDLYRRNDTKEIFVNQSFKFTKY